MQSQDLKKVGIKATLPRMRILQVLKDSPEPHMSAEDVYQRLIETGGKVGLATIYRTLSQFEEAGLIIRHNFDGNRHVFEINRGPHHDHIVCLDTGKVIEFRSEHIESLQREIVHQRGYVLEDHSLVLYVRPQKKQ